MSAARRAREAALVWLRPWHAAKRIRELDESLDHMVLAFGDLLALPLRQDGAAGLGHPDKTGQQITFGSPMARDGDGSRVLVDLPYGKGLDDAMQARGKIASGLDVTVSQVFIHRDPTSHRRHVLWVADRDPLAVPVGRTPLLACKPTDIWRPVPFGLDERGGLVEVPLLWNSVLVSALPRQGKTFGARSLALDPYVRLDVFDFKGSRTGAGSTSSRTPTGSG